MLQHQGAILVAESGLGVTVYGFITGTKSDGSTYTSAKQTGVDTTTLDFTDIYNEVYTNGSNSVDTIINKGYETSEQGVTDYTKLWIRLENNQTIGNIDISGAYNAGAASATISASDISLARDSNYTIDISNGVRYIRVIPTVKGTAYSYKSVYIQDVWDAGRNSYTNSTKTIYSNGTYTPGTNERWSNVVVNTPTYNIKSTTTITRNGTYKASEDNCDGYAQVVVNTPTYTNSTKTITTNGTYNSGDTVRWNKVVVNVPDRWDSGAKTAKVASVGVATNGICVTSGRHHYINTTITATAKATLSDGSTYTATKQTINDNANVNADAVWDEAYAEGTNDGYQDGYTAGLQDGGIDWNYVVAKSYDTSIVGKYVDFYYGTQYVGGGRIQADY